MGQLHKQNENFFTDYLLFPLLKDLDISDKNLKGEIYSTFFYFLENVLEDETDLQYLDFDITKKDDYYKLIAKNLVSALWFSSIFPDDPTSVLDSNIFVLDNKKYMFDYDKNKLLIEDFGE
jgi:hypothetical protein